MITSIIFLLFVLIGSELTHMVAVHQEMGLIKYPFGATFFCYLFHIFVLISGVWYLGFVGGIILTILDMFSIIHITIGWILSVPSFLTSIDAINNYINFELSILAPFVVLTNIYGIISFFITDYKTLIVSPIWTSHILTIIIVIAFIGFILRIIVQNFIKD